MYHRQITYVEGVNRRVHWTDTGTAGATAQNSRTALITLSPGQTWYIGYGAPTGHVGDPNDPLWPVTANVQQVLQGLGGRLWIGGVVNTDGLDYVF
jgi:hypothetical protein